MTAFSQVLERVPPRIVNIPLDAWADDWVDKPREVVTAGLRLLSEMDLQMARASATEKAFAAHKDPVGRIESFCDHLMAWAVACALTEPGDVTQPYFGSPHENVQEAFTSKGIKFLWEELELLHVIRSPLIDEAEDDTIAELAAMLADGRVAHLPEGKQARMRRLLTHVLEELDTEPLADPEDDA